MTNDDTAFREIEQAIAEDRQSQFLRQFGPIMIGGAIAVVLAVAAYQFWTGARGRVAGEAASALREALVELEADAAKGEVALERLAATGPAGYAAIAKLRLAALRATDGRTAEAMGLYREIYGDARQPGQLRDLTRVRAAFLALPEGREAVAREAGPLATEKTPLGYFAREAIAIAALRAGDIQTAESMFLEAARSIDAPEGVRLRGAEFAAIASAAKAGVSIELPEPAETSGLDAFIDQLQKTGGDLGSLLDAASPDAAASDGSGSDAPPADAPAPPSAEQEAKPE